MRSLKHLFTSAVLMLCAFFASAQKDSLAALYYKPITFNSADYQQIQKELASGWNTWNNNSMLCQVLLPEGFSLHLGMKDRRLFGEYIREFYPMDNEMPDIVVRPGKVRSFDGTYTDVNIEWKGIHFRVESASHEQQLYWLITPIALPRIRPHLVVEAAMLWQRKGNIQLAGESIIATTGRKRIEVYTTAPKVKDLIVPSFVPYLSFQLNETPIGISTGKKLSVEQIANIIRRKRMEVESQASVYGQLAETFQAMQAVLGWSTIYEPMYNRVVTPGAGRWWNKRFNNYVLWGWDFTALNFMPFDRKLAYANLIEIIRHKTPEGFFPNYAMGYDIASRDRAQPPVYSIAANALYKQYNEKWFLQIVFSHLLDNNRWWNQTRSYDGYLCWGSTLVLMDWDAHTKQAAKFESGLDNSPMFDEAVFDSSTHLLMQGDVGLMSLYVLDCEALAEIAGWLDKKNEQQELLQRASAYRNKLKTMWDESSGLYLNFRLDTNEPNRRISPTNFYPLLLKLPTAQQAERMLKEHLQNEKEFFGKWLLPSTPRNDPAYSDQSYWRGRIWPPMNVLIYMGMKNYGNLSYCNELAINSNTLLMNTYKASGWVRENYHADHGDGTPCNDKCFGGSDVYYTWGAMMGIPLFMEKGYFKF
ncbi:MGH1-like glycoside hydrolase domain-containing protein [Lacibacter sp.]|uniref:MGH1-like glycoside hydrolase domain-containing protein n=1 Tax=Lacibacter sp. TaxID=1915409 RepID=UPI002B4B8063|nr:trehalase family glycosidase [Lacibacter sp.]HLP38193.1 trehalase family glycosidase [Lacibacter sp.]